MITFKCINNGKEAGGGKIVYLIKNYEHHCEIKIESRSGITVLFGRESSSGFACIPDFGAGCHLVELKNKFWNTERLIRTIGEVDGITVATLCIR
ncbi:MAG: hypothetical protein ACLKAK_00015 [Alkaliphilus sp.]